MIMLANIHGRYIRTIAADWIAADWKSGLFLCEDLLVYDDKFDIITFYDLKLNIKHKFDKFPALVKNCIGDNKNLIFTSMDKNYITIWKRDKFFKKINIDVELINIKFVD